MDKLHVEYATLARRVCLWRQPPRQISGGLHTRTAADLPRALSR